MLVWQMLAEKVEMRRTPGGDVLVVVAVGDGPQTTSSSTSGSGCRMRRTARRPGNPGQP